jgi:DMSO/TMAO reductase YedYZ molybdopterin-dependent catalytic subunit
MFGTGLSSGALGFLGAEVVPALTSGGLFIWLLSREDALTLARSRAAGTLSRRRVLRQAGFAFALLAGTAVVWEIVQKGAASLGLAGTGGSAPPLNISSTPDQITPPPVPVYGSWTPVVGQTTEVTSTTRFYYVSKNLVGDPAIDSGQWQLQITGLIDHAKTFSFADIQAMPQVQRYQTLECISNEVGGDLMSTTLWTGTRIADILMAAGIQAGASQMIFHCADGYSDRHHLSQALDPRALIVYAMNGQPLPQAHGFPARLLIPGRYGMKNGKWVTSLELATGDYQGYWEQQGWTSEAVVKLTSRIDVPGDGELLERRPINLAGVAFAGDQGIGRVEVSTDAGQTWTAAHLKRPLSDLTWVLWELPWSPPPGSHVVAVRAIDLAGRMQTSQTATPLPDGATGYHAITVTVG